MYKNTSDVAAGIIDSDKKTEAKIVDFMLTLVPPGCVMAYSPNIYIPPRGWLICDGSTKLIDDYPQLAYVLGTTYGPNNGTTFTLPDMRGRIVVAQKASGAFNLAIGSTLGEETHTLSILEMPSHTHTHNGNGNGAGGDNLGLINIATGSSGNVTTTASVTVPAIAGTTYPILDNTPGEPDLISTPAALTINSTGGGQAHNNIQPSLVMTYIIKY